MESTVNVVFVMALMIFSQKVRQFLDLRNITRLSRENFNQQNFVVFGVRFMFGEQFGKGLKSEKVIPTLLNFSQTMFDNNGLNTATTLIVN
jgi:hypothetical protein